MKGTILLCLFLVSSGCFAEETQSEQSFLAFANTIASGDKVFASELRGTNRQELVRLGWKHVQNDGPVEDSFLVALAMLGDNSAAEAIAAKLESERSIIAPDYPAALNGGPALIAALSRRMLKEEAFTAQVSDIITYPVSYGAAFSIMSTVSNCEHFRPM